MTEMKPPEPTSGEIPCRELFIYYIQGVVRQDHHFDQNRFIGNWQEEDFSFLFFSEAADESVRRILAEQKELILLDQYCMSYEQWQGGPVETFRAGKFLIIPPWEKEPDEQGDDIRIFLDPGVVFGTGSHPTTRDCLGLLEQLCAEENIGRVLDMGTGTGLLAIAAARLGCRQVLALDFNWLAARTAGKNIHLNQLDDRILAYQGKAEDFTDLSADLFIANIHYDVMKELIRSKGFLEKKYFILSGLLRSEAIAVDSVLSEYPVEIIERRERDGVWHTVCGKMSR